MTLLYTDPLFLKHATGNHPECSSRLVTVLERLAQDELLSRCRRGEFTPVSPDEITRVHDPEVATLAAELAHSGGGAIDADTIVSPASYDVARAAAGACAAAVDAVVRGDDSTALCLIRPPGHHATPERSMGFCLFNNVAIAARRARHEHGVSRILIVDWDVHHGNGTQDIFERDPDVFFFSIHRYGHGFYPGSGAADETGTGPGLGFTRNLPVRYGTSRADFRRLFTTELEAVADKFRPELVLLSAGFDAHRADPIGSLDLESEDYAPLTRSLLDVARTHAQGRLISCLEGGYNAEALAESVGVHLQELLSA